VLGISERAVRKRITAGQLDARKEGSAWVLLLPATTEALSAAPAASGAVPTAASLGGTVDLAPMADLITDLTRQNLELAAAAALWQERARLMGERLQALEAGPIASEFRPESGQNASQELTVATERDVAGVRASEDHGGRSGASVAALVAAGDRGRVSGTNVAAV
jgi:hypothetical protein